MTAQQRSKTPPSKKPMDETAYLLSSPKNASRLREAIRQMDAGQGIHVDPGIFDGTAYAG